MNVHTMPIVVDLRTLALQRPAPAAACADEYARKLIPLRALAAPIDFRIGMPLLPVRRPSVH